MHEDVCFFPAAELAKNIKGWELSTVEAGGVVGLAGRQRGQLKLEFVDLLDLGSGKKAVDHKLDDPLRPALRQQRREHDWADTREWGGSRSPHRLVPDVPCQLHRLPVGMQSVGRRFDGAKVLAEGAAFARGVPGPRSKQTSGTDSQKNGKRG